MIRFRLLAALSVALLCVSACDQTEEPVPFQIEAGTLTLYGFLDATRNVQRARIEPRRQDLDYPRTPEGAFLDDTEVLSYRLGENIDGSPTDTVRWVQRAERLPNGTYAAVFSASFRPLPLERYRVVTRRAAGPEGPAVEAVKDVTIPAAGPPVEGAWRREDDRVLLPIVWPDSLQARLDTIQALHIGCLYNDVETLEEPDTLTYLVDTVLVGADTLVVFGGAKGVLIDGVPYPIIEDTLYVGEDAIPLAYELITELLFSRPIPPRRWGTTSPVDVVQQDGAFTVEVDLSRTVQRVRAGASDGAVVRYDQLRLGVRVRDAEWTGDELDPDAPAVGFLGGVNADTHYEEPSPEALEAAGAQAGRIGAVCG